MALARVKVWIPGDVLTAADLNGEFNNVINNPITLVSPTTGVINFNLQVHTNLLPTVITATSGTAGQALISTGGTTVSFGTPTIPPASFSGLSSGQLLIGTSSGGATTINQGSSGQVLAVTSSNTNASFRAADSMVSQALYFTSFNSLAAASTSYYGPSGVDTVSPANVAITLPSSGILYNLRVSHSASPGVGQTFTNTVFVQNAATTMSCLTTDANTQGSDLVDKITVNAGDNLAIRFQSGAGAAATRASASVLYIRSTL